MDIFVAWASEKIVRKILLLSGLSLFISLSSRSSSCSLSGGDPGSLSSASLACREALRRHRGWPAVSCPPFLLSLPGSVAVSLSLSLSFSLSLFSLSLYVSFPCVHSASSQPVVTVST